MRFLEITDQAPWDAFQVRQPWNQFPQTWTWGEFRRSFGLDVRRFGLFDEAGALLVASQMEFRPKRFGVGYWFAPRGPVFSPTLPTEGRRAAFTAFLDGLLAARLRRPFFWRFEPPVGLHDPEGLMPMRFRRNVPQNPSSTILLDLAPSADDLLAAMHQKTRYNIRVAAKHGVAVRVATHPDDVTAFLDLMDATANRDGFIQHSRTYLQETFAFLHPLGMARIRLAEAGGKPLAANMEIISGTTVTYLYGASGDEARHMMAPYALHWDAIMQAKRDGIQTYDFWGANPPSRSMPAYKASWEGITRFKAGWGGRQVDLVGTWDLPTILPLYRLAFLKEGWRS
ncbi:MAG: peptidoglycan bridge formation glycyltransferase FemA/FemB family protein [Patescibacteria group bacterium]